MIYDFEPNEDFKRMMRTALESVAAASASAAIMSFISQVLVNGIFVPKKTKIVIDGDIPAELIALGGKKAPEAVFISTKKRSVNVAPALVFAAVALILRKYLDDEKNNS
ncbi:MAG: hypothetical protein IJ446_06795 [Oscillospiraceae bacterium]|nr:hypothetical protein [Oscillospiraceae bacterium]